MADRMYRKVQRVDDGLWSGIKKLFGGDDGKKKRKKNDDPEHEVGDKIKFERRNGQNANGVIENVYYNEEDGGIDYGVRSTRSTDNIVVPEENIIDSRIKDNMSMEDYSRSQRKRGYREMKYLDIVNESNDYLVKGYGHINKFFKSLGMENVESGFLNEEEQTDYFEIWAFEDANFTLDDPEGVIVYFDKNGNESYCEVLAI